jgi:hypothetical protein
MDENKSSTKNNDINKIRLELLNLTEAIQEYQTLYSNKRVIFRGFISGIASALGATIGFAIVIFIIARIIQSLNIPIIDKIIEQTGIDKYIEQVDTNSQSIQNNNIIEATPIVTNTPKPTPVVTEVEDDD